jgi:hypothetical protein
MAGPPSPPDQPVSAGERGESATTLVRSGLVAAVLGVVSIGASARFRATLADQRERVGHGSQVISSRFGQIEYAIAGTGPPVLVAHGAGGGFDQVISVAARLIAAGHQVIIPSRLGCLRSSSPVDTTLDDQADAFVRNRRPRRPGTVARARCPDQSGHRAGHAVGGARWRKFMPRVRRGTAQPPSPSGPGRTSPPAPLPPGTSPTREPRHRVEWQKGWRRPSES